MAIKRHSVDVKLTGNASGLESEVRKGGFALRDLKKYTGDAGNAARGAAKDLDHIGNAAASNARHFGGLGNAAASAARMLGPLFAVFSVAKIVDTARDMEVLRAALTTVTGSAEAASATFAGIQEWAAKTPYSVQQATEAFTRLKSIGLDPTEQALTSYGNTAAAMGKDLMQMVEAVADAATGEFERLKEFGIRASKQGDDVSFTFKGVTETVKMNSEEIQKYLMKIGQVDFAGSMDERAKTVDGALSNLGDSFDRLFDTIGQSGMNEAIIDIARSASSVTDAVSDWIGSGAAVDYLAESVNMLGIEFAGAQTELELMVEEDRKLFNEIGVAVHEMPANWRVAWEMIVAFHDRGMAGIRAHYADMAVSAATAWESMRYAGEQAWNYLKLGAARATDSIVKSFVAMISPIGGALSALGMDDMASSVKSVEASLRSFATAESTVRGEIVQSVAAHKSRLAALQDERSEIEQTKVLRIASADANVQSTYKETRAMLENRDAAVSRAFELQKAAREEEKNNKLSQFATGSYQANTAATNDNAKATKAAAKEKSEAEKAAKKLAAETDKAAKAEAKHRDELMRTIEALDPAERSAREYFDALDDLDGALAANIINESRHQELLAAAAEKYQWTGSAAQKAAEESAKASKSMAEQADPVAKAWEGAIERIDEAFADAWSGAFSSFKEFGSSLKDAFVGLLGELAHAAITRPILVSLGLGAAGTASAGQAGQAGGFGIDSLLGMVTGNSIGGSIGKMGGIFSGAGAYSNWMYGGAGLLGGALGSTAGGYGSAGGSVGALAGMALGGPFGAALGAALGSAVGSLFGAEWKTKGGGVNLSYSGGDVGGSSWETQKKTQLWNTRTRTVTGALDGEIESALQASLDTIAGSIASTANAWGIDATQTIAGFAASARIDLTGLSEEEAQSALQGWVNDVGRELMAAVMPSMGGIIRMAGDRASELLQPLAQLGAYLREDFAPTVQQSFWDAAQAQKSMVQQMAAAYDGSVDATIALGAAVDQRLQIETQLLQQIGAIKDSVADTFAATRESIYLDTADAATKYTYFMSAADMAKAELEAATDPSEVQQLTSEINRSILSAWGVLNEEQKTSMQEAFQTYSTGIEAIANQRLDQASSSLMDSHQQITDQINRALGLAADRQLQAANAQIAAANALIAAANAQTSAASSGATMNLFGRQVSEAEYYAFYAANP